MKMLITMLAVSLVFIAPPAHAGAGLYFSHGDPQDILNRQYKTFLVVKNISPSTITDYRGHILNIDKPMPRKLRSFINSNIDWTSYSRAMFSSKWSELDKKQQDSFTMLARKLAMRKYGKHLSPSADFSARFNDSTKYQTRPGKELAKVPVVIVSKKNVKFDVEFIFCKGPKRWAICDIYIDGVSHTRTYAKQVEKIYNRKGFDGVVKAFERAIRKS